MLARLIRSGQRVAVLLLVVGVAVLSVVQARSAHAMAVVILGGLVTSILLNLFLVPSLYWRSGRRQSLDPHPHPHPHPKPTALREAPRQQVPVPAR